MEEDQQQPPSTPPADNVAVDPTPSAPSEAAPTTPSTDPGASSDPTEPTIPSKPTSAGPPSAGRPSTTKAPDVSTDPEVTTSNPVSANPSAPTTPNNATSDAPPPLTDDPSPTTESPVDAHPITPTTAAAVGMKSIHDLEEEVKPAYDFLKRKDIYVRPESHLPEDAEFQLAKAFLMTASGKTDMNLYDHLTTTVMRVLETRPKDAVDIFESISSEIKRSKFNVEVPGAPGSIKRAFEDGSWNKLFKEQMTLFEKVPEDEEKMEEGGGEIPDVMDLANLWEWAGVAFGKEDTFTLFLALKRLVTEKPLKSVRLWGRIQSLTAPYIIVEGELREGAVDDDEIIANPPPVIEENSGEVKEDEKVKGLFVDEEGVAVKSKVKGFLPLGVEQRTGVNKYVYYACNYAGGPWTRLPDVIPEKLQASRRIRKYFTGNLQHQIVSYPAFDGTEAQYLRCQIARISAATVASPAGYYMFDPEEGEGEDGEHSSTIIINPEYEGLPNDALLSATNWVHHVPYVLPQGRTTYEAPQEEKIAAGGGEDGEDGEEGGSEGEGGSEDGGSGDGEGGEAVEPETGPQILSSLAADEDISDGIPAWTSRACSTLSPTKFTPIVLRSTRWPGAIVVAYNDKFANIYVGDGHRDLPGGLLIPPPLPEIQKEFVMTVKRVKEGEDEEETVEVELTEMKDPTVEEEKAFEEAKKAREEAGKEEEEGEEEAGSEGQGDEEDD